MSYTTLKVSCDMEVVKLSELTKLEWRALWRSPFSRSLFMNHVKFVASTDLTDTQTNLTASPLLYNECSFIISGRCFGVAETEHRDKNQISALLILSAFFFRYGFFPSFLLKLNLPTTFMTLPAITVSKDGKSNVTSQV